LIFQAFFVFLLFQKKRIEGGKKFKRKNIFSGDFDVFASCPAGNPRINSLIAAKKQRKKKTPTHHKLSRCSGFNLRFPLPALQVNLFPLRFILTINVYYCKICLL